MTFLHKIMLPNDNDHFFDNVDLTMRVGLWVLGILVKTFTFKILNIEWIGGVGDCSLFTIR